MKKILISGSRYINRDGIEYAKTLTQKLITDEYSHLIVGDNPKGVDDAVITLFAHYQSKQLIKFPRMTIYGIDHDSRHNLSFWADYRRMESPLNRRAQFQQRDAWMCDMSDEGYFIWNGYSTGTKTAYDYMVSLGKPATLVTFRHSANGGV